MSSGSHPGRAPWSHRSPRGRRRPTPRPSRNPSPSPSPRWSWSWSWSPSANPSRNRSPSTCQALSPSRSRSRSPTWCRRRWRPSTRPCRSSWRMRPRPKGPTPRSTSSPSMPTRSPMRPRRRSSIPRPPTAVLDSPYTPVGGHDAAVIATPRPAPLDGRARRVRGRAVGARGSLGAGRREGARVRGGPRHPHHPHGVPAPRHRGRVARARQPDRVTLAETATCAYDWSQQTP